MKPEVHPEAAIYPGAILLGDVRVGAGSVVLPGAVVVSQGAPTRIGERCIIMENAVIRGAGRHRCQLGDHVLVGPHAHVSGATVESNCFLATGATILNGAIVGEGSTVAVHGIVQIGTRCPPDSFIPMHHIGFGDPVRVYPPDEALDVHSGLFEMGFTAEVFGFNSSAMSNGEATRMLCRRYARALVRRVPRPSDDPNERS